MNFWTAVLRKSGNYWVALCLENGIVGQGLTDDEAMQNLKDALDSYEESRCFDENIYNSPISINDLHEFLSVEGPEPLSMHYELRAIEACA
ncbi:MAG TPA: type II toxin-antitoxin system HicB family antitoxin [Candidatus Kapabacteria bacterium]|nr:type II toxin-antitoxin system HicB family antitoxin [Candidatus Kapabacteria bacterium]